jgi:hypothetical protein
MSLRMRKGAHTFSKCVLHTSVIMTDIMEYKVRNCIPVYFVEIPLH